MTSLHISIDGSAAQALLERIANNASHLQPTLNAIAHDITENIRLTFRDLKSPYGVPWKPLSPVTKFNRAARASGGKVYRKDGKGTLAKFTKAYLSADPLNDTGVLRNSIHHQTSDYAVEIGTNLKQAAMMNFGGTKAEFGHLWGDIPARPFMPMEHLPISWETQVLDSIKFNLGIV